MQKVTAGDRPLLVRDLYEIRAQILGFQANKEIIYHGFVNEKGIPEGLKRKATKIAKLINSDIESIDKQRLDIASLTQDGLSEEELKKLRDEKDKELLDDEVDFQCEKLDFSKIENLSLSGNYQFLYDSIFKE